MVFLAFAVAACAGGTGVATPEAAANDPTEAPVDVTPEPTDDSSVDESTEPEATAEPDGPVQYKPGEKISVTQNDEPWADIVVSKVKQVKSYKGTYFSDTPKKGNVFIQAYVTYTAMTDGVNYNPFDWQVFVNGTAVENYTILANGPNPELRSGTLPKGRKAAGYVVYEVPARGKVLMSYGGSAFSNEGPVFEVLIRGK